jgi:TonB family protein
MGAAEAAKLSFGAGFGATAGIAAGRRVGKFVGCAAIVVGIVAVLLFLGSITSVFRFVKSVFAPSRPATTATAASIPTQRERRLSDLQRRRAEAAEEAQAFEHEDDNRAAVRPPSPQVTNPGVYRVGGGVSAPSVLYKVDPPYTEEARLAKLSGTVLVSLIIGEDGRARNIKIVRGLGLGLDERAAEAVAQWRFKPGIKDGTAVSTQATIEVKFRLL